MFNAITQKLYDWWRFSRTIFINAAMAIVAMLAEVMTFLVGFDWASLGLSPRVVGYVVLAVNVVNIVLRFKTTAPPGEKIG